MSREPSEAPGLRESLRTLLVFVRLSFSNFPALALATALLVPLSWVMLPLEALWIRRLVDSVTQNPAEANFAAVALAATVCGMWLTSTVGERVMRTLGNRLGLVLDRQMTRLWTRIPGLEHHERPEYLDRLELLRTESWILKQALESFMHFAGISARLAISVVLLVRLHPLLLLLPAAGIPSFLTGRSVEKRLDRVQLRTAPSRRLSRHLFDLATSAGAGKELRVFAAGDEILRRRRTAWRDAHDREFAVQWRGAAATTAAAIFFSAGYAAAVALMVVRASQGRASAGDVVMALVLSAQMNGMLGSAVGQTTWLVGALRTASRYVWLQDYAAGAPGPATPVQAPQALREGIHLDRVSFRYPGTDAWVLSDVDLRLPAGIVVALVGENGAGKTSLVKLLCRFYEPSAGTIRVDGADLADLDVEQWRSRLSGAFQDYARFEFLLRESVGVGRLEDLDDAGRVSHAMARAGASEVTASLPRGLGTQLGSRWQEGEELSGGQWQKLALARALMRPEPLLLILDEPTSALDAQTEHALFERFAAESRKGGRVTLLVSHRFSTVRMADLIVVLDAGKVAEAGSHAQLMAKGGLYADLYSIQAKAYS
ncbi:MAG TPA: ABC transporter ATP-binding protein [Actinomycetota bacterium]|nr:ABC transporter ATP-binding protein [Actinomycetota bacterium]